MKLKRKKRKSGKRMVVIVERERTVAQPEVKLDLPSLGKVSPFAGSYVFVFVFFLPQRFLTVCVYVM